MVDSLMDEHPGQKDMLIGVVGPCGAGKSTLIEGLARLGYRTRHIAQEHSYVKDMWKRLTNPNILVFLDASYTVICQRRKLDWTEVDWQEQQRRLNHAREHADLYVETDLLSREEVLEKVVRFVEESNDEKKN
jgi:deoxyadenosine/deoxycytidine kinase